MIAALAAAAAPALISSLLNRKRISQVPLETPEQAAARQKLNGFSNTGTFGDFTAGADQNLGYGDFNATAPEQTGLSQLQQLLTSGIPSQYQMGDKALADFLNPDPNAIQAQFDPFKAQTERQITQSNNDLKRTAGYAGNLYSTNAIKGLGDIQARGNETLTSKLAELTNQALDRKMQAIPLAYQSAQDQEAMKLGRVGASQQYGDLTRQLNDASIKARDAEILRRRQELQLPIQAAQTVAGGNSNFGIPSVSQATPFQSVLDIASQIGGQYVGNKMTADLYSRYFPQGTNPPTTTNPPRVGQWPY